MKYGLTETTVENICAVFARFPEIEKALLYGSRAKGNFKTGSDIDLTLCGEAITSDLRSTIASELDDLLLPYTIDLSVFNELNHVKLREHIERVGVLFYERANHGAAMKKGWKKKPFEECIEKVTYTSKVQRKDFLDDGAYPIISQEVDFINGYWDNEADLFKVTTPIVVFGDHTKVLKYVDFDFVLGADGVKVLQPQDFLLPKFFFYQLQTANLDSLGYARHYKLLKELEIVYPARPEQQRIVGILDEAFEGIATAKANAEKNLQNACALFESHLQSVFTQRGPGWVDRTLDQVCIVERGSSPRPIKNYFTNEPDGVNWIKIGDTKEGGKYVYSTAQKITPEGAKQSRFVKEGDFILTNSMSFGRPYIMKTSGYIHDGWFVLRLNISIDTDYFYYLLSSRFVQSQFAQLASGSVVKNISGDLVKKAVLPIPPLAHQQVIVEKLLELSAETQRLEAIYQQKLDALEALKKSLLHQAFSGHL